MQETDSRNEIKSLTGVRFLLVSMVFLIHYVDRLQVFGTVGVGIVNQFYLSLHMFFVLSGFVIGYKYFDAASGNRNFLVSYYLKRFSKIYPIYFALTSLTYFIWWTKTGSSPALLKEYLLNITFIRGFSQDYYLSGIGPAWSLSVEELFYLFSPLIFVLIKRRNLFFTQLIGWWAIGAVLLFCFRYFPNDGFFGSAYFVYFATFFGRCFEFYCGIFLALQILGHRHLSGLQRKSFRWSAFTWGGIGWMAVGIALLYVNQYRHANDSLAKILLSNLFYPVGVAIFYFGLIRERTWLQRWLSTRPLQLLGHSSYAFFLVHTGVVAVGLEKYLTRNVALLFVLLQLVSIGIFLFFERPLSRLIRSRLPAGT